MFIRHLALLNPIQFIASFAIKSLIKRYDMPTIIFSLIDILYHTSYRLISTVGIFPVYRILRDIRKFLANFDGSNSKAISELQKFLTERHSTFLVETFIQNLTPVFNKCFPVKYGLYYIYDFFFIGFLTTILKPVLRYIIKFLLGLVLSALGIIWNESLSSISYLKDFSIYIIEYIEAHSNFGIPRFDRVPLDTNPSVNPAQTQPILPVVTTEEVNIPNEEQKIPEDVQNTGTLLAFLGIILVVTVGVVTVIGVTDYFAHETVQNIPGVNAIADTVHVIWNTTYDSITNYFKGPKHIPEPGTFNPDAITRSSSGESDITIRDYKTQTFTPPASRPDTPLPSNDFDKYFKDVY